VWEIHTQALSRVVGAKMWPAAYTTTTTPHTNLFIALSENLDPSASGLTLVVSFSFQLYVFCCVSLSRSLHNSSRHDLASAHWIFMGTSCKQHNVLKLLKDFCTLC